MATPKVVAEYIGTEGAHLGNVPASDLTQEDMDALTEEQRESLLANAASPHAIYKLHGRDIKAEAKEVAAEVAPPAAPEPPAEVTVRATEPAPRARTKE